MTLSKKQEVIKNELEAIYEEFYTSINQMLLLEKFFKILVEFANGDHTEDDMNEFIKKTKMERTYLPEIIKKKVEYLKVIK